MFELTGSVTSFFIISQDTIMEVTPQISHLREFDEPHFSSATSRLDRPSNYLINRARRDELNGYDKLKNSMTSGTVYVGHLTLSTTEEQIYEAFSKAGRISRVIMGLNAHDQSPTGFCFVEFESPKGALNAVKYLNKTKVNGKNVEIDLDPGFEDGRQYGRAENGAQKSQYYSMINGGRSFGRGRGRGRGRGGRGRGGRSGKVGRDRFPATAPFNSQMPTSSKFDFQPPSIPTQQYQQPQYGQYQQPQYDRYNQYNHQYQQYDQYNHYAQYNQYAHPQQQIQQHQQHQQPYGGQYSGPQYGGHYGGQQYGAQYAGQYNNQYSGQYNNQYNGQYQQYQQFNTGESQQNLNYEQQNTSNS